MGKDSIEFSYSLNLTGHIFQAFNISNPIYKATILPNYAVSSVFSCNLFQEIEFHVIFRCSVPIQFRIELIMCSKKKGFQSIKQKQK